MKEDKDVIQISNESVFLVSLATEYFLEYFAKKSYSQSQGEKRRTVTYKDIANVVKDIDQLEFLSDVVPESVPFKK
jgi:histone H3/H4